MDVWWNNHFLWKDLVHPIETGCLRFQEFMSHNCSRISSEQRHQNRKTPWAGDSLWDEQTRAPGESFRGLVKRCFWHQKTEMCHFWDAKPKPKWGFWRFRGYEYVWVMNLFPFCSCSGDIRWVFSPKSRLFWYKIADIYQAFCTSVAKLIHLKVPLSYFPMPKHIGTSGYFLQWCRAAWQPWSLWRLPWFGCGIVWRASKSHHLWAGFDLLLVVIWYEPNQSNMDRIWALSQI